MRSLVWQWGRYGGGPRYAFELAKALQAYTGLKTQLSMSKAAEILDLNNCRSSVDLPISTYSGNFGFIAKTLTINHWLGGVLKNVSAHRPHVAINTMPGYWDLFLVRRLRKIGVPVVTIVHDATVHPGDKFPLIDKIQRRMVGHSTAVITLSDFVANGLRESGFRDKPIITIPHVVFAMDELALPPVTSPEYRGDRPLKLLIAGRLKAYKGLELLVESLDHLESGAIHIRVAGPASDPGALEPLQKAYPKVELQLGWLSDLEFIRNLTWADLVVLPYIEASQSGVIPLAYKCARPVIATPVGGLPEQVQHGVTGLLASDVSASAIAGAIEAFLADPGLLKACSQGALRVATSSWSWAEIAPRFAEVLAEAAQRDVARS